METYEFFISVRYNGGRESEIAYHALVLFLERIKNPELHASHYPPALINSAFVFKQIFSDLLCDEYIKGLFHRQQKCFFDLRA
jgi:hypothetical protein